MPHITITPVTGLVTIRAGEQELARSARALELREGSMPPRLYIPREDVAMDHLMRSSTTTTCPHKGTATYYSLAETPDIAWSYETPKSDVADISGHLSFYDTAVLTERS